MSENYEKQVYLAMIAEQCSRYEDMINFLEEMIKLKVEDLSSDERNLLSIAYKNSLSLRRTAIRTLLAYENKEAKKSDSPYIDFIKEYKVKVFKELESVCNKIITTIDSYLLQKAADAEAKVFYNKMKGDYYRYVAENAEDELKKKYSELGLSAYNVAMEAGKELNYNNSTLLGLALNLSVFCYEVLVNPTEAIRISKETLEKGKKELLGIDEDNEEYRDSISIINLLQENLNMWTMDNENVI